MMPVPSMEQELSLLNEENVLLQKLEEWVSSQGSGTNQRGHSLGLCKMRGLVGSNNL